LKYDYFSFTKNELILYIYLLKQNKTEFDLRTSDFISLGMPKNSFYNGRDGLIKRGYLKKNSQNHYFFDEGGSLNKEEVI
jgi:hypothetical protein